MYEQRRPRVHKALVIAQRRLHRHERAMVEATAEVERLRKHQVYLEEENRVNSHPIQAVLRLDSGFASRENIAWLIEMGYGFYTKARSSQLAEQLTAAVTSESEWQRVGGNASLMAWANTTVAGIKEGMNVFHMHHLKVRSPQALLLQEHFACFAANFIRFAALWLSQQEATTPPLDTTSVKHLVQVCAHTSAWVRRHGDVWLLTFAEQSLYAGRSLRFGIGAIQLPLPALVMVSARIGRFASEWVVIVSASCLPTREKSAPERRVLLLKRQVMLANIRCLAETMTIAPLPLFRNVRFVTFEPECTLVAINLR